MDNRELGAWGEKKAAGYLRLHGYKILEMNCRFRQGEIDIIASKRGYIVFVEVKLRKNDSYAEAREYVTAAKLQPRFDVIEIYAPDGSKGKVKINHIENAF